MKLPISYKGDSTLKTVNIQQWRGLAVDLLWRQMKKLY